jgi:stage II sporulation protein GA (sporulation sigma-E factor processing peptidase)
MIVYLDAVFFLNFLIDYLLLICSNSLFGHPQRWLRTALAAVIGGAYATLCMLPPLGLLVHPVFRILCLVSMSVTAFGISIAALRKSAIFFLLSMALGGLTIWMDYDGKISILGSLIGLVGICFLGLWGRPWNRKTVPVEITNGDMHITMTALYDTGNLLRDPISGSTVLVIGRDVAQRLVGLNTEQLRNPIKTMSSALIPGLRLIPYKTISQSDGILLGQYFPSVKVGGVNGGSLVAFSPEILSSDGSYQALTGGIR